MYLHLGNETVVQMRDVIGIFDIEKTSVSKFTKEFLNMASKSSQVLNVSYEMPKSFVVCQKDGQTVIYISQISPQTLLKRARK
jgi:hypothetical protein